MTAEECAILLKRTERAEAAYDDLLVGDSVRVLVDQNGERMEFTSANRAALATHIQSLKRDYGNECSLDTSAKSSSGPMRFLF
jgi:hypothetical protein